MRICQECNNVFDKADWHCPTCGHQPPVIDGFPALAANLASSGEGFQSKYFKVLAELEARHFWFRNRNLIILWALQKFFPQMQRYLEIGCGTGFVLSAVAAAYPTSALTGSEIFSAGLPFAAARVPHVELLQMDARSIPYMKHFDVVGAFDVLEHIREDDAVLHAIHCALRRGGGLVLTVPQHPWLWSRQDELACHERRYTHNELVEKLNRAGFEVRLSTSFVSLLLPIMWIARRLRTDQTKEDTMSELRIGDTANRMLGSVMRLELAALRSGMRFPMGGSLLIVAERTG
jgi:SAM-dependent methyltransferase